MDTFSKTEIIKDLRVFCKGYKTAAEAAAAIKISAAQLSQTLTGKKRMIPERILKKLGYKLESFYVSTTGKKAATRTLRRNSADGEIVSQSYVDANPDSTEVESLRHHAGPAVTPEPTPIIDISAKD